MTTSGSYDFKTTAGQIIRDALLLNGAIDPINDVSASDYEICLRFLNMIIKNIQKDANLWVNTDTTITLTPGTQSYTVGTGLTINIPKPSKLKHCRRRDSSGTEISIEVASRQDYMDQPVKSTQAPALMAYYDPQISNGVLYVWPTGSSGNVTLIATFQRPIQDFDAIGNNPDLPDGWSVWLVYQLAASISPIYSGQLNVSFQEIASGMLGNLKSFDTEQTSICFQPRNK